MTELDLRSIAQLRMRRQRLWGRPLSNPDAVFGWMGPIQGQEFPLAKWSIGQRARGTTSAAVDRAFAAGNILRTHMLRPTWHLVAPQDIRWIQDLTGPRVRAHSNSMLTKLELPPRFLSRTARIFTKALAGGTHLTRKELAEVLRRKGIEAQGQRLAYIVMAAELDAVICSGSMRGKQHTYALVEDRAPGARALSREAALAELTRRYFLSRGPATIKDFGWWSSLKMQDIRDGLEMVGSELRSQVIGDRTYFFGGRAAPAVAGVIDLVQPYEEIVISYSESRDALLGRPGRFSTTTDRPLFMSTILLDGQLIGHWRPVSAKDELVVEAFFYRRLRPSERDAMDAAVDRYGAFVERPASWVAPGPKG